MTYVQLDSTLFYGIHPTIQPLSWKPDLFVDLTHEKDNIPHGDCFWKQILSWPTPDRNVPKKLDQLVELILQANHRKEKVYIACRGGHGRSGVVAACVYGQKHQLSSKETLNYVQKSWREQREMSYLRPIIRKLGSPQTRRQKEAVYEYLSFV